MTDARPAGTGAHTPDSRHAPTVSVVLCTYNRGDSLGRTIETVLAEAVDDLELVIVDDGSTDGTAEVLGRLHDRRVRVVHRPNGGLSAARNSGLAAARGDWVVFLDDDDIPAPGWLAALTAWADDDAVGIACVGARFVDERGRETGHRIPSALGPVFGDVSGSYLAGTFAVRRDVVAAAGGYIDGLGASHQFELFLRLVEQARTRGLGVAVDPAPLLDVERRPPTGRPLNNPRLLMDASRWVLARHASPFRRDHRLRADCESIAGANAARLGDWRTARRYLARSLRSDPLSLPRAGRLALALVPPAGRRVWGRQGSWATHDAAERGVPLQLDLQAERRELFLPWGYRENPPASADAGGTPFWGEGLHSSDVRYQDPVYRVAAGLVHRHGWDPLVDVGCGTGHKLVDRVGAVTTRFVGADQPSAIALARSHFRDRTWVEGDLDDERLWERLARAGPRLVLCADVIEHVDDPVALLLRLRRLAGTSGRVLVSTPDRSRLERSSDLGPPTNPRHIREWAQDELELLAASTGFRVERAWHLLPRRYSATRTELNRAAYRALHLRAVPDRRSSMALLLAPEERQG